MARVDHNDHEGVLLADGWEDAFIGFASHFGGNTPRLIAVYDYEKMIKICQERDGMGEEEAIEFLEYNTIGAHVGIGTPAYLTIKGTLKEARERLLG